MITTGRLLKLLLVLALSILGKGSLKERTVATIAGTGKQSSSDDAKGAARGRSQFALGLQLAGRTLYIAMGGPHQIWSLDLERMQLAVFAGTGREGRGDGALDESAFGHHGRGPLRGGQRSQHHSRH